MPMEPIYLVQALFSGRITYRNLHQPALIAGGSFVLVAISVSLLLILQHLRSYTNPSEQKWIVAVLFMVPVYATESLLSLLNYRLSLACDILRNCYEAFALYSFGSYLIACLGGEARVLEILETDSQRQLVQPFLKEDDEEKQGRPLRQRSSIINFFCHPCVIGRDLFNIERFGLVQYMILKTLCAFLAFVLEIFGVYGDGRFKVYYGYPYMAVVLNFSQMWALYCLVQFYNVTHERLKPIKPLAKFISFKAIVFATWWQGVGIALLCSFEALPNDPKFRTGLQDFLICIEMAIAAITHAYVFPADPYQYVPDHPKNGNLKAAIDRRSSSSKEKLNLGGSGNKEGVVEKKETRVEAAGTSVSESVQDIVVQGGQHVVKDVVLTINQAMGPVEKGVTKIHQTFHRRSMSSGVEEGAEGEAEIVLEK
ncbi:Protein LAZ1 homolog 2 [Linum perenne]